MPFESQAQRALAHAVMSGKAKGGGMTKAAAKRMIADDPGGKLPAKKCNPCKSKGESSISSSLSRALLRSERENNMDET